MIRGADYDYRLFSSAGTNPKIPTDKSSKRILAFLAVDSFYPLEKIFGLFGADFRMTSTI